MSSQRLQRRPNAKIQSSAYWPWSSWTKKTLILSGIFVIGSAAIYHQYIALKSRQASARLSSPTAEDTAPEENTEHELLSTFSSQSLHEKKLAKFESKKEKLIVKNARLRSEADIQKDLREQRKQFKRNQLKFSYFEKEHTEYVEFSQLLMAKDSVLKPRIIYEYVVLLVRLYCGDNWCTTLTRDAHCIDKHGDDHHTLGVHRVNRIQSVFPVIKHRAWNSTLSSLSFNTNVHKTEIVARSEYGFGILTERSVPRHVQLDKLTKVNDREQTYAVHPLFLNKRHEWVVFEHDIYFASLFKDYACLSAETASRMDVLDNSYRNTRNILDAMLILNNKYGHIALFATETGVFYSDPRLSYRDIKKPWKSENSDDSKAADAADTLMPQLPPAVQLQLRVSNALMCSTKPVQSTSTEREICKLFSCEQNVYVLSNDGALYRLLWNDDHIALSKKEYQKLVQSLDDRQPNYRIVRKEEFSKTVQIEFERDDPMRKEMELFRAQTAMQKLEQECNAELRQHNLIRVEKYKQFKLQKKIPNLLIYGVHFCNVHDVLYFCQQKRDIASWTLRILAEEDEKVRSFENKYRQFMDEHPDLQKESFFIMFVDSRNIDCQYLIIILNQHMLRIPLIGNDNHRQFAEVYDIDECVPDLVQRCNGCKWFFSTASQSLLMFEVLSKSGSNPYRFRRIHLDCFRFD